MVVGRNCDIFDMLRLGGAPHRKLITFVAGRPGHDRRDAIDPAKIELDLGRRAQETFESGIETSVCRHLASE